MPDAAAKRQELIQGIQQAETQRDIWARRVCFLQGSLAYHDELHPPPPETAEPPPVNRAARRRASKGKPVANGAAEGHAAHP